MHTDTRSKPCISTQTDTLKPNRELECRPSKGGAPKRMPMHIFTQIHNQNLSNCKYAPKTFRCLPYGKFAIEPHHVANRLAKTCQCILFRQIRRQNPSQSQIGRPKCMPMHIFTQICNQTQSSRKPPPNRNPTLKKYRLKQFSFSARISSHEKGVEIRY